MEPMIGSPAQHIPDRSTPDMTSSLVKGSNVDAQGPCVIGVGVRQTGAASRDSIRRSRSARGAEPDEARPTGSRREPLTSRLPQLGLVIALLPLGGRIRRKGDGDTQRWRRRGFPLMMAHQKNRRWISRRSVSREVSPLPVQRGNTLHHRMPATTPNAGL